MKSTEEIIAEVGLEVPKLHAIPLDEIDHSVERSQTRERTYDVDALATYVNWIEMGSPTPPVIVHKNGNGLYSVLAGDHRVEANRIAGSTELAAYIVKDATAAQAAEIRYRSNTGHGLFYGQRERLEAAVHLVREMGRSVPTVAAEMGVKPRELKGRIDEENATDDLAAVGFDPTLIPVASRLKLRPLRADNAVLRQAAELTHQSALSAADVTALVKKIREAGSERERLAIVKNEGKRLQPERSAALAGAKKRPLLRTLIRSLNQITTLDLDELSTELSPNPELSYQIGTAIAVLTEIAEAVNANAEGT